MDPSEGYDLALLEQLLDDNPSAKAAFNYIIRKYVTEIERWQKKCQDIVDEYEDRVYRFTN